MWSALDSSYSSGVPFDSPVGFLSLCTCSFSPMKKLSVKDLELRGKRVLVRVDFNVPMEEKDGQMVFKDVTRMQETLPTLELLIAKGAKIVLVSHLGRPKGKREPSMSLRPVPEKLAEMIRCPVAFVDDCIGEKVENAVALLKAGDILLLENVRFYREEESNDPAFAEKLARLADVYVNDAFGTAHRAHASTEGVARVIASRGGPCAAGLLMERELEFLGEELEHPTPPFVVILGGAKVSDKINVIERLLEKASTILVGGAITYTFRLALGCAVGKSLVEPDRVAVARTALEKAKARGVQFFLPLDNIVATPVETGKVNQKWESVIEFRNPRVNDGFDIPDTEAGLDIGPKTIKAYAEIISQAQTILFGPMSR